MEFEKWRVRDGLRGSDESCGANGGFLIPYDGRTFKVCISDGEGWEHVSISLPSRCPKWGELAYFKKAFWGSEDTVIQYHPAKSDYVNRHPFCLHLWRPLNADLPKPPLIFV